MAGDEDHVGPPRLIDSTLQAPKRDVSVERDLLTRAETDRAQAARLNYRGHGQTQRRGSPVTPTQKRLRGYRPAADEADEKIVADGVIGEESTAVVVSTAHGLKFAEAKGRLHVPADHDTTLPGALRDLANPPLHVGADVGQVRALLAERLA